MKKIYQVFVQDIWNNNYLIGFFKNLDDAIPGINSFIDAKKMKLKPGDLQEYPGTFGPVIDVSLYDIVKDREDITEQDLWESDVSDEMSSLYIRGFILEVEDTLDELIE